MALSDLIHQNTPLSSAQVRQIFFHVVNQHSFSAGDLPCDFYVNKEHRIRNYKTICLCGTGVFYLHSSIYKCFEVFLFLQPNLTLKTHTQIPNK